MVGSLHGLFEDVMSGREYDAQQVKNATNITNTIVKVLRFEFDVYKHFSESAKIPNFKEPEEPPNQYKPRNDFTGVPRRKSSYD